MYKKQTDNVWYLTQIAAVLVLTLSLVGALQAACDTPGNCNVVVWEPLEFCFGTGLGTAIANRITSAGTLEGYVMSRFQDTAYDSDVEECERSTWDVLSSGNGILVVVSHGSGAGVGVVFASDKVVLLDEANGGGWADSDSDKSADSGLGYVDDATHGHHIYATSDWFEDNWSEACGDCNAIVYLAACRSMSNGCVAACGGRVGFGYTSDVYSPYMTSNAEELFDHMSGVEGVDYRPAGEAFSAGSYHPAFDIDSNGDTTLCPAVIDWYPQGATGDPVSGYGYIELDTNCNTDIPATSALTYTMLEGSVGFYDVVWQGSNMITFNYCVYSRPYTVQVTGVKGSLRSEGGLCLDGNQNPAESNGRAPNYDSFIYTFSDGD